MHEWTINSSRHDRSRSVFGSPGGGERRRGMPVEIPVELLLGGLHIPGIIEYRARGDQVTFTIKKVPLSAPGESWPIRSAEDTDNVQPRLYMKKQHEEIKDAIKDHSGTVWDTRGTIQLSSSLACEGDWKLHVVYSISGPHRPYRRI